MGGREGRYGTGTSSRGGAAYVHVFGMAIAGGVGAAAAYRSQRQNLFEICNWQAHRAIRARACPTGTSGKLQTIQGKGYR